MRTNGTLEIHTSAYNPDTQCWDVHDIEHIPSDEVLPLGEWVSLSSADLGCEPGEQHLVEAFDAAGHLLDSGYFEAS